MDTNGNDTISYQNHYLIYFTVLSHIYKRLHLKQSYSLISSKVCNL